MILDTRGREESIEQLIEELQTAIAGLGAEVGGSENLGRRDFARQADVNLPAGNYVQFHVAAAPDFGARLRDHFRLNKLVNRTLFQAV